MLGKGLESLIPSNGHGDDPSKKTPPPPDLPFADSASFDFLDSVPEEKKKDSSQKTDNFQFVAPGPKNPNPEPHRTIDPVRIDPAPQIKSPEPVQTKPEPTPSFAPPVSSPSFSHQPAPSRVDYVKPEIKKQEKPEKSDFIFYLEVDKITPNPNQPRKHFSEDAIRELASSIREFGILQPVVVTKKVKDTDHGTEVEYELIAGERRLRAVKLLGLPTIPAIIRNVELERERLELAVIENLQREDLNVIEIARSYARLQDEFRMTQREVAAKLGKSRESVANTLRLLDLPMQIQDALAEGRLSESHGRLLLTLEDPAAQQRLFEEILQKPMTTRELRGKVQSMTHKGKEETRHGLPIEMKMLQERLTSELGAPVVIEQHGETGKITIRFYSPEELQQIINRLAKEQEF